MSPRSTLDDLLAVTAHGDVDRADLEAACHLIESNKLSVQQAAMILLHADSSTVAASTLQPSPTIAELLEAWGPPPRDVLEDWIEQLRLQLVALQRRAAECDLAPPDVASALAPGAIRVDPQNRLAAIELAALHDSLVAEGAPSAQESDQSFEPASSAKLHPDYRSALREFVQQIAPYDAEAILLGGTDQEGTCRGAESTDVKPAALAVDVDEFASTAQSRRSLKRNTGKAIPGRFGVGVFLAIVAAGVAFVVLNRGEPSEGPKASSNAGTRGPSETLTDHSERSNDEGEVEEVNGFESFESESAPLLQSPAENDSPALLDQFAHVGGASLSPSLSPSEPPLFGDDPSGNGERSRSVGDVLSRTDQENGSSGSDQRTAGEEEAGGEADSAMAADPPDGEDVDLETTIDSAHDRPAPIVDDSSVDAVLLPPHDNSALSARLHPEPAEDVSLGFLGPIVDGEPREAVNPSLRLVADAENGPEDFSAWEVVAAKEKDSRTVVGRIFGDPSGTHFVWGADVQPRFAADLRSARLQFRFANAPSRSVFLHPSQQTDPVAFDFEQQTLEIAWQLGTPPHPLASRLQIDFHLPDSIEYAWVEPTASQPLRNLVAIAEFTLDESEFVALRIRFVVQTGSRFVSRVRYAARIDAMHSWQWVTLPDVIEESDRIAMQQSAILANLRQIDSLDGRRGRRSQREMVRQHREVLEQRSKQLATIAERLGHLMQLMQALQTEGQIGWRIIADWPDGPQEIFATPFQRAK